MTFIMYKNELKLCCDDINFWLSELTNYYVNSGIHIFLHGFTMQVSQYKTLLTLLRNRIALIVCFDGKSKGTTIASLLEKNMPLMIILPAQIVQLLGLIPMPVHFQSNDLLLGKAAVQSEILQPKIECPSSGTLVILHYELHQHCKLYALIISC